MSFSNYINPESTNKSNLFRVCFTCNVISVQSLLIDNSVLEVRLINELIHLLLRLDDVSHTRYVHNQNHQKTQEIHFYVQITVLIFNTNIETFINHDTFT